MPVQTMSHKSAEEKWVNRPRRREKDPYIRLLEMVCLKAKWNNYHTDLNDLFRRKICHPCYRRLRAKDTKYYTEASHHILALRRHLVNFKYCLICTEEIYTWGTAAQCSDCVASFMHLSNKNEEALELGVALNVLEAHERAQPRPQ